METERGLVRKYEEVEENTWLSSKGSRRLKAEATIQNATRGSNTTVAGFIFSVVGRK